MLLQTPLRGFSKSVWKLHGGPVQGWSLGKFIKFLIIAVCTTFLSIFLGCPAAFALARFEFRGKKDLWFWFITNRMVSPIVLALPFFLIVRNLKLLDTHLVLILIYLTFNLPIVIWICTDQFEQFQETWMKLQSSKGLLNGEFFVRFACRWQHLCCCFRYILFSSSPGMS